jgi:hypothetical protein
MLEEKDGGSFGSHLMFKRRGLLQDQHAQLVDGADELVGEQRCGADFLPLLMQRGRALEVHRLAGSVALGSDFVQQRLPPGEEEIKDPLRLARVLLGCACLRVALFARLHALVHLAVDTAGMLRIRLKIFIASAQQKEIEHGIASSLGGSARGEGTEGFAEGFLAEAIGGVDARMLVRHRHAQNIRGMQAQPPPRFLGAEGSACRSIKQERRFEVGAGARPLDPMNPRTEIQALGGHRLAMFVEYLGRRQQPAQSAAKVRSPC